MLIKRLAMLAGLLPTLAAAQRAPTDAGLGRVPLEVRREAVVRWNGPNAVRAATKLEIASGEEINGNVALQRGTLNIAGHVAGSVLAINGSVTLRPTARVDGDILVVGGTLTGRDSARVAGSVRVFGDTMAYREEGDRIIGVEAEAREVDTWWRRLERHADGNRSEAFRVVQAGAYNRVEGLPISLGPMAHRLTPWGSFDADAAAITRTGSFNSEHADVGHKLAGEVRFGRDRGIGIGGRVFNVVDPVENWQLSDLETALAAVIVRRDYRDYYQRHGTNGYVTLYGARDLSLTGSYGIERWTARPTHNPFSLFHGGEPWRPNPRLDEGVFHIADIALGVDTRTDPDDPWSGWWMRADAEHGSGTIESPGVTSDVVPRVGAVNYTRGFFDLRRYNRLGPDAQLNLRVLLGGLLGGDELPLERRLSVDGPGALPGYDFHGSRTGIDVGTCNAGVSLPGTPAECDRIALAQIEYRSDLRFDFSRIWGDWPRYYHGAHGDAVWVLFADAGRGWRAGTRDNGLTYSRTTFPPLSTFRSDVGVGLDIQGIGVYAAKSLATPSEPVNFFVRLRHRF
jgi:cytoskeletal protein CcmA (bactofilin family)